MSTKIRSTDYDLREDWSPANLNAIYPFFPANYNENPPANTKFNDNKDLRQLFTLGLAEEALHDTLERCAVSNPAIVEMNDRNAKNYVGDISFNFKKNFAYLTNLRDNEPPTPAAPVEDWHITPAYEMTGFGFCHLRGWEKEGQAENVDNMNNGTLYGEDTMLVLIRNKVFVLNNPLAISEIYHLAKYFAMGRMAAYNGDTTYASNLAAQHISKCNAFSSFQ